MATLSNTLGGVELSYAGVPFQVMSKELDGWIASRIPREYLQELVPVPSWLGRSMTALSGTLGPVRPMLAVNEFFYPAGAARWAEGSFLATESAALKMIAAAYSHTGGSTLQPFIMNAPVIGMTQDKDTNPGVSTNLYMLPPRPIAQTDTGLDGLYLVTLVDERYYGFLSPVSPTLDNGTTWSSYLTSLATALGVTITVGSIEAAFGNPSLDSSFYATLENSAFLLDAAAWNVCRTVVRKFDGTYTMIAHSDTSYAQTRPKFGVAGGAFSDALDSQNLIPTLEAVLPAKILVTFPKYWTDYGYIDQSGTVAKPGRYNPRVQEPYLDTITKTVNIASSTSVDVFGNAISQYHGIGTKAMHTTAKAYLTNFTDGVAVNDSDLQALAQKLADNLWSYQALGLDEVYLGIRGWQPEGGHDIYWTYRSERCTTRVMRRPWNSWPTEFQHELVPNSGNHDGPNAGVGCELIYCVDGTIDGSGRADAYIAAKGGAGATETTTNGEEVWLHAANGETLAAGYYVAKLMQLENGRKIFDTVVSAASAFSGASTTLASDQTLNSGADTTITHWNSPAADYDTASYSTNGSTFTVPSTGYYTVGAILNFDPNATGSRGVIIAINGTPLYWMVVGAGDGTEATRVHLSKDFKMNAGDTAQILGRQNSGGTLDVDFADSSSFWIHKIG